MKRKNKTPKPETYSLGTLVNWEEIKGMDYRIVWELDRVLAIFVGAALVHYVNNIMGFPENLMVRGEEITNPSKYSTEENFQRYVALLESIIDDLGVYLTDESELYSEEFKKRQKERAKAALTEADISELKNIDETRAAAGRRAFETIGEILPTLWD